MSSELGEGVEGACGEQEASCVWGKVDDRVVQEDRGWSNEEGYTGEGREGGMGAVQVGVVYGYEGSREVVEGDGRMVICSGTGSIDPVINSPSNVTHLYIMSDDMGCGKCALSYRMRYCIMW